MSILARVIRFTGTQQINFLSKISNKRINNNVKNTTDTSFNEWSTVNEIVDIKQTDMAELVVLHKSSDQSCVTVLSEFMSVSSEHCVPSTDIGNNEKLFLHDHKALMIVVYGQSGVYYRCDSGL